MKRAGPPSLMLKFLEWFCPRQLHEGIEGDLLEQYERDECKKGSVKAKLVFAFRVLQFFRPAIIFRNHLSVPITELNMLSNYLIIAIRNIAKNKVFSAINVI